MNNRQKEKEQGLAETLVLFRLCQKHPNERTWKNFKEVMDHHGFNEVDLETTEEELKTLQHEVFLNDAKAIVDCARKGFVNTSVIEKLAEYFTHSLVSPEELGLKPGEFEGFRMEAFENRCAIHGGEGGNPIRP